MEMTIDEAEGGREDKEKRQAKPGRKEQWGRKMRG